MNNSSTYRILGLMSGTSLDGVDLANCIISYEKNQKWIYEILETITVPYPSDWLKRIEVAYQNNQYDFDTLSVDYANYLADIILYHTKNWEYDYIASHGHTILHQPKNGITLQIGDGKTLTERLQKTVIFDFRTQDVALGGQGAPLVPIGDLLLFAEFDFCINLGGFANVSYLRDDENMVAYDICPINFVLNELSNRLGFAYDDGGKLAKKGKLIPELYRQLNALPYYRENPPKSLGREWVEKHINPFIQSHDILDLLHTYTLHTAYQISKILPDDNKKVLFTGGGTYNDFLIDEIRLLRPSLEFVIPDSIVIDYKESLIFAFLGVLKLRNEVNTLASVTGASKNHSGGKVVG